MTGELTYRDTLMVESDNGLHLVPCSQIARAASEFQGTITLRVGDRTADAKTIVEIVSLGASKGTAVEVEARGEGGDEAVGAIRALFQAGFPTGGAASDA